MEINLITAEQTWPIRHKILWPDQPFEYVKLPEDIDGQHFGLFVGERLVSIVSVFASGGDAQFRKLATLTEYQGNGYGTQLLKHVFDQLKAKKADRIWCNARASKASFYHRFGMKETDKAFVKEGIDYVVMEALFPS